MMPRVRAAGMRFSLPENFSRIPIQAKNRLRSASGVSSRQINAIANDRGRAVPASRYRRFPQDVVCFAPNCRRILARRRNPIPRRPAPPRPIQERIDGSRNDIRGNDNSNYRPDGFAEKMGTVHGFKVWLDLSCVSTNECFAIAICT